MNFVEWATVIALLVVAAGGLYAGVTRLGTVRPGYMTSSPARGAGMLAALLYFSGALMALIVAGLRIISTFR